MLSFDSSLKSDGSECFSCSKRHKGFVQNVLSAPHANTQIWMHARASRMPITPAYAWKRNIAERHRQDWVDTGQLPMMHCKFNVSSSAFCHQSQAISGLVWSAQSNRISCAPDRLVSSLLLLYLWVKCEFHIAKLHFVASGYTAPRPRQTSQKSALFTPHNIIMIEGARAVLETEAVWCGVAELRHLQALQICGNVFVKHRHADIQLAWCNRVTLIWKEEYL